MFRSNSKITHFPTQVYMSFFNISNLLLKSVQLCRYTLYTKVHRVSQEEGTKLRESVPYVKIYRYNPKHLYSKLNGYGDNGQRSLKL